MTRPASVENAPDRAAGATDAPEKAMRHFVSYAFYKVQTDFRKLDARARETAIRQFQEYLQTWSSRVKLYTYSTVGTRPDTDFLLWRISAQMDDFNTMSGALNKLSIGPYLDSAYAYLAMTRKSMYVDKHRHPGQEGTRLTIEPGEAKYLFIYPFVKTHDWYQLPMADRQQMMNEHIEVGHKYPTVRINTTYSYGLDDQEFVVAFESDQPGDFLDLVMELRTGKARPYTERDTPIFTCIKKSFKELCDEL
ncbi:MAG: hypothetical protein A3G34_00065 [Candidatus Lindowbacteria bacterium RIFCSPLOWO2_12_FULL_62_27]|nr:MAG: hypothetical protein A3G34_00065 [Candidatus Lindowbacteria bacterium RIFCSPLOWO2_12_FULL_62_27]OGH56680.1 MAG: hypothetical protein A3I06_07505 [Candidatus Lindowbacteria bacterium RIFCSPLOWO2_02_FULL_62_12]